jgi:hypothetical protein
MQAYVLDKRVKNPFKRFLIGILTGRRTRGSPAMNHGAAATPPMPWMLAVSIPKSDDEDDRPRMSPTFGILLSSLTSLRSTTARPRESLFTSWRSLCLQRTPVTRGSGRTTKTTGRRQPAATASGPSGRCRYFGAEIDIPSTLSLVFFHIFLIFLPMLHIFLPK